MHQRDVLLRELRLHLHLPAFGEAEQGARSRAHDLPELDVASEDKSRAWRSYVQLPDLRPGRAKLRLCDADLRISGIASSFLGIDFGLGDEAAALERQSPLVVRLGKGGIRSRCLD